MLVLTRKCKEAVVVGGFPSIYPELRITVLEIRGAKVKLGFATDPSVSIQRSEVWAQIHNGELPGGKTKKYEVRATG